jgi:L-fuconolactonase
MRIDAHQHFWKYDADEYAWIDEDMKALWRDFLPPDWLRANERVGFDGSVAVQANHSAAETDWLLALADRFSFIQAAVGWTDLCAQHVREELARLAGHPRLKGIRHVVQGEADDRFMARPDFQRGISALAEFGLTYDILIFPRHLSVAQELASAFPDQPFVVDHMAKPPVKERVLSPWDRDLRRLAERPNVMCKASGMVTEADWRRWSPDDLRPYLDVVFDAFGPERIMIGSDWPVCLVAGEYDEVMGAVLDYTDKLAVSERASVLGEAAARFYGIAGA